MLDATGEQARDVIERLLPARGVLVDRRRVATDLAEALQRKGLLSRCSCPVGFGSVRDGTCPVHRGEPHVVYGMDVRETRQMPVGVVGIGYPDEDTIRARAGEWDVGPTPGRSADG